MSEPEELPVGEPEVAFVVPASPYDEFVAEPSRSVDGPNVALTSDVMVDEVPTIDPTAAILDTLGSWKDEIAAKLAPVEALGKRLDGLQAALDRDARAEATREKVVDRLHAELQEYKDDLLLKILRPVFVDLIQLHDDMGKMIDAQGAAEGEAAKLLGLTRGFQQGVEDILYRQGVEPFQGDSPTFDPKRQRAVQTIPTEDPALARTVAARLRKGFLAGEKVVRPEIVSVYALKK